MVSICNDNNNNNNMSEPFIAEIKMFGGNFAPRGYSTCQGQLLPIAQNTALFSLVGTFYGGDGRTTFGLPDLRGRVPIGMGNGPGLSNVNIAQKGGQETTILNVGNLPPHSHTVSTKVNSGVGNNTSPLGNYIATSNDGENNFSTTSDNSGLATDAVSVGNTGVGQSFNNLPPFLGINFIIALQGVFPSRS